METLAEKWQAAFLQTIQRHEVAGPLREAALREALGNWTRELTNVAVRTCEVLGWRASAKGHRLTLLPFSRTEYLSLDLMAFEEGRNRWAFPVAVLELENSRNDDRIAYSLWKVLCVRADLRIVFCYRRNPEQGSALMRFLRDNVVHEMGLTGRTQLAGESLVIVGSRDESATFPYGFFKWWDLDKNTGTFRLM
jgi:hypothetical protein